MRANDTPKDRRADDQLLNAVSKLQKTLDDKHAENINTMFDMRNKLDKVIAGFPDSDPDMHRRAHEAMIRKAEARVKFWTELQAKLTERGIWAVVIAIATTFLFAIKEWIGQQK